MSERGLGSTIPVWRCSMVKSCARAPRGEKSNNNLRVRSKCQRERYLPLFLLLLRLRALVLRNECKHENVMKRIHHLLISAGRKKFDLPNDNGSTSNFLCSSPSFSRSNERTRADSYSLIIMNDTLCFSLFLFVPTFFFTMIIGQLRVNIELL